jgi:hypothetical protein
LTEEEILAEKLHQQKLQEESDLLVAMETFGVFGYLFLDLIHIYKHQYNGVILNLFSGQDILFLNWKCFKMTKTYEDSYICFC